MRKSLIDAVFVPLFLLLIVFPVVAVLLNLDRRGVERTLADGMFWHSVLNTTFAALAAAVLSVVLAVGFGYYHLFKRQSVIYRMADLLNDLPNALPHTVAGLGLLLAFGRKNFGFIGETGLAFTLTAVVLAMFFVSYPLAARTIVSGVDRMEREVVDVARTLGDTPARAYFKVVLPVMGEALFSGFVLAFSRSLSEFAAVVMFGGNLPGSTQVLASYVFTKVEEGELGMAVTAGAFCIVFSLLTVALLGLKRLRRHA